MNEEIKERIDMINRGEVPKGYKKTKLGIIPEDWEVKRLKNICKRINVGFVGTCEKYYTNKDEGIPMLRTGNLKDGKIVFDNLKYVTKKFHEVNIKSQINKGDILIARHGSNGQGAIYNFDDKANCLNIVIVSPDKNSMNGNYLYYQINSENTKKQVLAMTAGSTQGVINTREIEKINIIKIAFKEQQKIAQILSTWDKAIESKERLIEEKKEQKKGLMQRLLTGEVRLPGFEGEWEEVRLGELGECIRGVSYKPDDLLKKKGKDSITLLRANNIEDYQINHKEVQYVRKDRVKKKQIIQNKDIAIAMSSGSLKSVGKIGFCSSSEIGMCVGAFCSIFRTKNVNITSYIKHFFETSLYTNQLLSRLEGTNINNLKKSDIESLKIQIPIKEDETKKLSNILSTADKEIDLLNQELEQLKEQKKGLMQLLLTGKIRVSLQ